MNQLRTLHLYGSLAKTYGKRHRVCAGTFSDALRVIDCNHPGFLRKIMRGNWHCLRGNKTLMRSHEMYPHHIQLAVTGDLHLVPAISGGKSRGMKIIFTIVIGGALLATGIGGALGAFGAIGAAGGAAAGTAAAGFATGIGFMGITYGTVALMGAGLLLGGLSMLLAPVPHDTAADQKKQDSFTFAGPVNASDEGTSIPLAYGELIVGGVTIASDISNNTNYAYTGGYTYTGTTGDTGGVSGGGYDMSGAYRSASFSTVNL